MNFPPQAGVVATVRMEHDHLGVAHEYFLPSGPFAILPLTAMVATCIALFARDGAWASAALLVPLGAWMAFASYLSYASIPPR